MHLSEEEIWAYCYDPDQKENSSIRAHLNTCEYCKARLMAFSNDEKHLRNLPFPSAPDGFTHATVEKVMTRHLVRQARWDRILKGTVISSFVLAFGMILFYLHQQGPMSIDIPNVALRHWITIAIPLIVLLFSMRITDNRKGIS